MKNIHVLPTDKPSRFYIYKSNGVLFDQKIQMKYKGDSAPNQNIYITSDAEINEKTKPCWCVNTIKNTWNNDLIYYQGCMPQYHFIGFKKIILTTDQELIKNGVQAIDDEFLEWFIKNQSCSKVEYLKDKSNFKYKILIPEQEIKCYGIVSSCMKLICDCLLSDEKLTKINKPIGDFIIKNATPTQGLDGVYYHYTEVCNLLKKQQQTMHTDDEVIKLLIDCKNRFGGSDLDDYIHDNEVKKWFEKYKKYKKYEK